ncbi:ABC transporter permease subunit [Nocardioides marmorisolisilvae]|uniref:Inner-membrane translocator n=1 Tax=Nocardioides marmorisolisilvae TaxID=1542737 RepID=A0A3N0DWY3_9ACTN|nr:ABC transporter permease [Nocardioides marmorisolisilvae]RNL80107.1 inner-membrane translocator [Nocardioides marmorisolisilvae]
MGAFLSYTVIGIFTGAAYAIAASGLVLTYSTTRVFNIAHGAVGMVFAFLYWDFSVKQGLPVWLSLILVLGVCAPLTGVFIQRVITRGLGNAPVGASLVVTVAMTVMLIGIARQIWPPDARSLEQYFPDHLIHMGSVIVTWQQIITVVVSILVAAGLYVLLSRTRIGTAMRASVDNPDLLHLYGGRSDIVAALAWAVGTSLAALGGILLAPVIGLQYFDLTLLVISAYAAAMLGKLTNLPLTYVGAMGLGLGQSYIVGYLQYIPGHDKLTGLPAVMPALFLFAILVLLPQAPLRIGQVKGLVSAPVPTLGRSAVFGGGLIVVVILMAAGMADSDLLLVGTAATYGIVMLSLVLLTGYGGFVSLAQFTFAGVGAVAYAKLDQPNLFGLLVAVLISAAVGALVALPVLRLTGLYLALATMAFGLLMDKVVFTSSWAFEFNNPLNAKRLSIFGTHVNSIGNYTIMMTVFFVLISLVVVAVRRGPLGRILIATRDSQAACGTLGLDIRWVRVALFASSAGVAGLAGALLAGLRGTIVSNDFIFFNSLLLLVCVAIWGVTSVSGAAMGAIFLMLLNYLPGFLGKNESTQGLLFILLGAGAILIGRNPNGLMFWVFKIPSWIQGGLFPVLADRFPGMALKVRDFAGGDRDDEVIGEPGGAHAHRDEEEVDSDAVAAR